MKLFSIDADNFHLVVYGSTIFIDEDGQFSERFGSYVVIIGDRCFQFPTSKQLYDFLSQEMDCLIDPLPF